MTTSHSALARAEAFAKTLQLRVPILLGPMGGACPPSPMPAGSEAAAHS
jgi:nitronate monooxygenase